MRMKVVIDFMLMGLAYSMSHYCKSYWFEEVLVVNKYFGRQTGSYDFIAIIAMGVVITD